MLNAIIAFSLRNRALVLVLATLLVITGIYYLYHAPVDVFPELNRPTVTIMTEVPGRAPEEVEQLVTFPIEAAMNGTTGVERVRSASGIGLSIVWVEFNWGSDILRDQQIVAQRLQVVSLPDKVRPVIAPPSSLMGEIQLIGLDSAGEAASAMDLRTLADWVMRPRLLAVGGISQVSVIGGVVKQFHVLTDPARLALYGVTLENLTHAVEKANTATGGGFLLQRDKESLIRITGRALSLEALGNTIVAQKNGGVVRVRHVADVTFDGPVRRGDAAVRLKSSDADGQDQVEGGPAVILAIQKQPGANTILLDEKIRETLESLQEEIKQTHPAVRFHADIFKQSRFIRSAVDNVLEAVRDGILFVAVILFLFLWNFRTGLITLTALPLSLAVLGLFFKGFGITLNTMTLGGIAIAIGELVDDAIVDVENIYRRLKENKLVSGGVVSGESSAVHGSPLTAHHSPLRIIYEASSEVRNSIVYATLIVCLVVVPLFFLSGLEGRMFMPMGIAYIVTLMASLIISLTVTPVLASFLLPGAKFMEHREDSALVRWLKAVVRPFLHYTLRHPLKILAIAALLIALAAATLPFMGGEFLPRFNEGTLTINLVASPGTSLEESNRLATLAENMILELPEVRSTARRTGRAELDEHAEGVHSSDIEVQLEPAHSPRKGAFFAFLRHVPGLGGLGWEQRGRVQLEIEKDVEDRLSAIPGVSVSIGQPISHRLDHVMSGVRAQVAVKLFGNDLATLRAKAAEIEQAMRPVRGVVGLRVEPLEEIDQIRIDVLHDEAARYGRTPAEVAELLETALGGRTVSQVIDQQRTFDVVVWYTAAARNDIEAIRATLIDTPSGRVPLHQMAEVAPAGGPIAINRENVQRRIVVSCNVAGRDLGRVVADIRREITANVELPTGYFLEYGGQFQAQQEAGRQLWLLFPLALVSVFMLLWRAVESWRGALQVLVNVPLAFFGAVVALLISNPPSWEALQEHSWYEWPSVWIGATSLSVAHMVGFITLTGIVARNGIMMISHYVHLMRYEGEKFDEKMIVRGTLERLTPVLMTAATTMMGLIPLLMGAGETGKEILHPLAVVVVGGLISSTLLDQLVTPALFFKFGKKIYRPPQEVALAPPSLPIPP